MTQQQTAIEGIYEVCIGVLEPISAIQYWEQFGYRIRTLLRDAEAKSTSTARRK